MKNIISRSEYILSNYSCNYTLTVYCIATYKYFGAITAFQNFIMIKFDPIGAIKKLQLVT